MSKLIPRKIKKGLQSECRRKSEEVKMAAVCLSVYRRSHRTFRTISKGWPLVALLR